ncbi:MAG TPA: hypothetical protein VNB90_00175 [Cytophagaceae bacterium]|nr:hypothetical protein [Cytophagaceae bacterium]
MKKSLTLFLTLIFSGSMFAQDLRTQLETDYQQFVDAVKNKDGDKLKNVVSSAYYLNTKNELISAQVKFPDGFFASAPRMVYDLKKETFVKAFANGTTANSIYYGKDAFGSESLLILRFIKENEQWKFYNAQNKLSQDILAKCKAGDTTFLKTKDFYPDGNAPAVPAEITSIDFKATLDLFCEGYSVKIKINGIEQPGTDKTTNDIVVLGGVKKGTNTIEITATPITGKTMQRVMISIAKVVNTQEYEVFSMEDTALPASIVKQFTVN